MSPLIEIMLGWIIFCNKQRNIYCNTTKRLYGKLTLLYHSSDNCKEQHRKLLPFITFKKELVDEISFEGEIRVSMFDQVPNESYVYGIVNIGEDFDVDDLVNTNNDTLSKDEQVKILNKT